MKHRSTSKADKKRSAPKATGLAMLLSSAVALAAPATAPLAMLTAGIGLATVSQGVMAEIVFKNDMPIVVADNSSWANSTSISLSIPKGDQATLANWIEKLFDRRYPARTDTGKPMVVGGLAYNTNRADVTLVTTDSSGNQDQTDYAFFNADGDYYDKLVTQISRYVAEQKGSRPVEPAGDSHSGEIKLASKNENVIISDDSKFVINDTVISKSHSNFSKFTSSQAVLYGLAQIFADYPEIERELGGRPDRIHIDAVSYDSSTQHYAFQLTVDKSDHAPSQITLEGVVGNIKFMTTNDAKKLAQALLDAAPATARSHPTDQGNQYTPKIAQAGQSPAIQAELKKARALKSTLNQVLQLAIDNIQQDKNSPSPKALLLGSWSVENPNIKGDAYGADIIIKFTLTDGSQTVSAHLSNDLTKRFMAAVQYFDSATRWLSGLSESNYQQLLNNPNYASADWQHLAAIVELFGEPSGATPSPEAEREADIGLAYVKHWGEKLPPWVGVNRGNLDRLAGNIIKGHASQEYRAAIDDTWGKFQQTDAYKVMQGSDWSEDEIKAFATANLEAEDYAYKGGGIALKAMGFAGLAYSSWQLSIAGHQLATAPANSLAYALAASGVGFKTTELALGTIGMGLSLGESLAGESAAATLGAASGIFGAVSVPIAGILVGAAGLAQVAITEQKASYEATDLMFALAKEYDKNFPFVRQGSQLNADFDPATAAAPLVINAFYPISKMDFNTGEVSYGPSRVDYQSGLSLQAHPMSQWFETHWPNIRHFDFTADVVQLPVTPARDVVQLQGEVIGGSTMGGYKGERDWLTDRGLDVGTSNQANTMRGLEVMTQPNSKVDIMLNKQPKTLLMPVALGSDKYYARSFYFDFNYDVTKGPNFAYWDDKYPWNMRYQVHGRGGNYAIALNSLTRNVSLVLNDDYKAASGKTLTSTWNLFLPASVASDDRVTDVRSDSFEIKGSGYNFTVEVSNPNSRVTYHSNDGATWNVDLKSKTAQVVSIAAYDRNGHYRTASALEALGLPFADHFVVTDYNDPQSHKSQYYTMDKQGSGYTYSADWIPV